MVHQREGGGKISSPHLVKYFGAKTPPKMGRCDPNWIIMLFVIHLDAFGVEKLEDSTHETIFTSRTQFGKTHSETFYKSFEVLNNFFGGKTLSINSFTSSWYSTHREISNNAIIASIRVCMQKLGHSKVDLLVFTPIVWEDGMSAPIIHGKWARHLFFM